MAALVRGGRGVEKARFLVRYKRGMDAKDILIDLLSREDCNVSHACLSIAFRPGISAYPHPGQTLWRYVYLSFHASLVLFNGTSRPKLTTVSILLSPLFRCLELKGDMRMQFTRRHPRRNNSRKLSRNWTRLTGWSRTPANSPTLS